MRYSNLYENSVLYWSDGTAQPERESDSGIEARTPHANHSQEGSEMRPQSDHGNPNPNRIRNPNRPATGIDYDMDEDCDQNEDRIENRQQGSPLERTLVRRRE
jgi:hypothetical protein